MCYVVSNERMMNWEKRKWSWHVLKYTCPQRLEKLLIRIASPLNMGLPE
jgi:hypothetical protein